MGLFDNLFNKKENNQKIESNPPNSEKMPSDFLEQKIKNIQNELDNAVDRLKRHSSLISAKEVSLFTSKYINKMINKYGLAEVQKAVDIDNNPYNPITNYITSLFEISILEQAFRQNLASSDKTVHYERMWALSWAINVSIANDLKYAGIKRIPTIKMGQTAIYYSIDLVEQLVKRVDHLTSQFDGAMPNEVQGLINNLIKTKL